MTCALSDCDTDERYLRRSLCQKHYLRLMHWGDPSFVNSGAMLHQLMSKAPASSKRKQRIGQANTHHAHSAGGSTTPTYNSWTSMKARCLNPNADNYDYYGGRGITIDPRWDDFETFLADMGERPEGTTLDRIDNDGDYEPGNVRWATRSEQAANRRRAGQGATANR